jgi:AraC-like DNA-binding protein
MNDFASAAMLRVLHAGMRRLGVHSPAQQWLRKATVPLDAKRQLVGTVLMHCGIPALLHLGQGVHDELDSSVVSLLVHHRQPQRVLSAWLRLERFVHSRHRLKQTVVSDCAVDHHHVSLLVGTKPTAAEDLVVLGVLIALLERSGCSNISAKFANGVTVWPLGDADQISNAYQNTATSKWRLTWDIPEAVPEVKAAALSSAVPMQLTTSLTKQVLAMLQYQGTETISVQQLAQHCCMSVRTFQRQLAQEGVRFVDVVAKFRTESAARLLSNTANSLAEIGFVSGYTDQAHFCRDFKRHVGLSPLKYRQENQSDMT